MSATKKRTLNKEKDKAIAPLVPSSKNFGLRKRTKGDDESKDLPKKTTLDKSDQNTANSESQGEYEVEQIVGKQVLSNVIFYQVKWKGFSMDETTWEPAENLENAPMKIRDYENSLLEKKKPKGKLSVQKSIKAVNEPKKLLGKRSKEAVEAKSATNLEKSRKSFINKKTKNKGIKKEETTPKPEVCTDQLDEESDDKVCKMVKLAYHHELGFIEEKNSALLTAQNETKKTVEVLDFPKKSTTNPESETIIINNIVAQNHPITPQEVESAQTNQMVVTPDELPAPIQTTTLFYQTAESNKKTTPTPSKNSNKPLLKIHRNQDEYGSFNRGDAPTKVIGVRHTKEKSDLEVMVSWKSRDDGRQPINSKVTRLELLQKGFWMPLLQFYESKMKMENSPDFNPECLPKF